jgi:hypothetical protein
MYEVCPKTSALLFTNKSEIDTATPATDETESYLMDLISWFDMLPLLQTRHRDSFCKLTFNSISEQNFVLGP